MASLIDQFKNEQSKTEIQKSFVGTQAFKNLKLEQEPAIFHKQKINFTPASSITHMVVNNDHLILVLKNMILMKIDLLKRNSVEEVDLSKTNPGKLLSIYFDPTGQHILLSILGQDKNAFTVFYLNWSSNKIKVCNKFKGNIISAVAWPCRYFQDNCTGPIIIGTSDGIIYEVNLTMEDGIFSNSAEKYCKQIYEMKIDSDPYINNIQLLKNPHNPINYIIFIATTGAVHQYKGDINSDDIPVFSSVFYNTELGTKLIEVDILPSPLPQFQLIYEKNSNIPKSYVIYSNENILVGDFNWDKIPETSIFNKRNFPFPQIVDNKLEFCGIISTQFHIVVLHEDKVNALCLLNNQIVYEDKVQEECGKFIGITEDVSNHTIWIFAEKAIFKYKVQNENRNIWRIYLDMENYDMAKIHCSDSNNLNYISYMKASNLFEKGFYKEAAKVYAEIPCCIEEICLKFVNENAEDALKLYLTLKMEDIKSDDSTQMSIIVMWLLELYLKELGHLKDSVGKSSHLYLTADSNFKEFIRHSKVKIYMNQNAPAVYNLLSAHDDEDNYVAIALIMKDFNRVIQHFISCGRFHEALELMSTQHSEKLFYQHTSALLQEIPKQTVKALISLGSKIDPLVILPSFSHYQVTKGFNTDIMQYIEYCIEELAIKDESLHNFLITLYCNGAPEKLISYLKVQGDDSNYVCYDPKFALCECKATGHNEACIHILLAMSHYQAAVELALEIDLSLAKAVAKRTKGDEEICKKLWLLITAHVVKEEKSISKAMEVLKECSQIKIEDILPFFPDFVKINDFKDAICTALHDYNKHIDVMKTEMEDSTKVSNEIRENIKKVKHKKVTILSLDKCEECKYPLHGTSFYAFNCTHKFHTDCLKEAIFKYLSEENRLKFYEAEASLRGLFSSLDKKHDSNIWNEKEQRKLAIDSIIASECLYCGEIAINNINLPFISDEEWGQTLSDWL